MEQTTNPNNKRRRPLTVWELASLLTPMHQYRRTNKKPKMMRPHFAAILGFIYRNRFALACQIQRRFHTILKSDRTARRHLEEMQTIGLIDVAPTRSVGPLWPKVYFVTGRGVKKLREALARQGKPWQAVRIDRKSRHAVEGFSAEHVLHEIMITEFLLMVWQTIENRPDLELLQVERRSLKRHPAYRLTLDGRPTRLEPDAMFLFRQKDRGMMCCYVEMDTGHMNLKQIRAKFHRYDAWAQWPVGLRYLAEVYRRHGAANPRPVFRLLLVMGARLGNMIDRRSVAVLRGIEHFGRVRDRLWLTTQDRLRLREHEIAPLAGSVWFQSPAFLQNERGEPLF